MTVDPSRQVLFLSLPAALAVDQQEALPSHFAQAHPVIQSVTYDAGQPGVWVEYVASDVPAADVEELLRSRIASLMAVDEVIRPEVEVELPGSLRATPQAEDPFLEAARRGWVHDTAGALTYQGPLARLYREIDCAVQETASTLGAEEVILPSLLDPSTLRTTNYLPAQAHVVNEVLARKPGSVDRVLAPAVCQAYYPTLAARSLSGSLVVTGYARAYRHEGVALHGMRRMGEFGIREIICVGSRTEIGRLRTSLLGLLSDLLKRSGLAARVVTASDAFFLDDYAQMRLYQMSMRLKHEAQVTLPYDGSALAVASVNLHGDHFGSAWKITASDGAPAHSCCLGVGIDRWCLAMLAQHGLDPMNWFLA